MNQHTEFMKKSAEERIDIIKNAFAEASLAAESHETGTVHEDPTMENILRVLAPEMFMEISKVKIDKSNLRNVVDFYSEVWNKFSELAKTNKKISCINVADYSDKCMVMISSAYLKETYYYSHEKDLEEGHISKDCLMQFQTLLEEHSDDFRFMPVEDDEFEVAGFVLPIKLFDAVKEYQK